MNRSKHENEYFMYVFPDNATRHETHAADRGGEGIVICYLADVNPAILINYAP
ncbi:MAG: hypothetical protein R3C17_18665 [Planctomycetaceae bacterium]